MASLKWSLIAVAIALSLPSMTAGLSEMKVSGQASASDATFARMVMQGQPKSPNEWMQHARRVAGDAGSKLFNIANPYDRLPPLGVDPDFECAWRKAAYEYAKKLQPKQQNMRAIFDALQLSTCNQSYTGPSTVSRPTFALPLKATDDNTFYVAPDGSDSNPGTMDKPFATIERAVEATRGLPVSSQPGTILLRSGVHRLSRTLMLGSADSGLTLQNYNGEDAVVTGAIDLGQLSWQKYNVTNGTSNWVREDNQNAVYGCTPNPSGPVLIHGKTDNADECEAACKADARCNVWTWHDPQQTGYENECWFRYDGKWAPTPESGHTSGYKSGGAMNVWVAQLSNPPSEITGLRVNNMRAIRARYPNANPELDQFPTGWISGSTKWFGPLHGTEPDTNIEVTSPNRSFEQDEFQNFELGVGGTCQSFTPPEGYWCSSKTSGGGAFTYRIPAGLVYDSSLLPHSPGYTNAKGAIVQAWRPGHWASWMFEVDNWNKDNSTFGWSRGGFQGARGNDKGAEWFVENIFEELDWQNEFYFDPSSGKLYFFYNDTVGTSPPTSGIEATNLKEYIRIVSDQADPVKGVTIRGITFRDGALTYMDPHGMPSGGDWGLQRTALVFAEGTHNLTVAGCNFTRNDGISVMLSGYNRYALVQDNEFVWNGETAIASWGFTDNMDGTNGEQPRFSMIYNNLIHELGHYEKQSSPYFQAKTAQSHIKGNIFFNGPRALINMNDGFGGGTMIEDNLLFNSCRESSDHGPINSWDRQPFLTTVRNGTASLIPAYTYIQSNFVVANYGADGGCFDTDDGSAWYIVQNNFFVYGGHKSDFNGHNKRSYNNINVYPQVYGPRCVSVPLPDPKLGHDWDEGYSNCTCVLATAGETYLNLDNCPKDVTQDDLTIMLGNNRLYAPQKQVSIKCGQQYSLDQWQAKGFDKGTQVFDSVNATQIIEWAHELLGF